MRCQGTWCHRLRGYKHQDGPSCWVSDSLKNISSHRNEFISNPSVANIYATERFLKIKMRDFFDDCFCQDKRMLVLMTKASKKALQCLKQIKNGRFQQMTWIAQINAKLYS